MRRVAGRHESQLGEIERVAHVRRRTQVAVMHRIERAAEQRRAAPGIVISVRRAGRRSR